MCNSNSIQENTRNFHQFSRRDERRDIWITNESREGDPLQDSMTLQDFGIPSSLDSPHVSSTREVGRGDRRWLQGPTSGPDEIDALPAPVDRTDSSGSDSGSSSSYSSREEERGDEYFEGFTDTDDEDEELTCNLCERSFRTVRRLEQHQQRRLHYMCSVCDAVFDGLLLLEAHKEALDHWSDYEIKVRGTCDHGDYRGRGEELRRLLL